MAGKYYSLGDVARYYGVSYQTVWRWVQWGWLPATQRVLRGVRNRGMRPVYSITQAQMRKVSKLLDENESRLPVSLRTRLQKQRIAKEK